MSSKKVTIICCDSCEREITPHNEVYHGISWDRTLFPNPVMSPQAQSGGLVDLCKNCFISLLFKYIKGLEEE